MPERIRLRRTAGWRMPPNTVKVTRPGPFGNPFKLEEYGRERALDLFAEMLARTDRRYIYRNRDLVNEWREYPADALLLTALGGRNVACFCPLTLPCHGDVLLAHVLALGESFDENPESAG